MSTLHTWCIGIIGFLVIIVTGMFSNSPIVTLIVGGLIFVTTFFTGWLRRKENNKKYG